jgi:putative hydrolase of the HAD superfamily
LQFAFFNLQSLPQPPHSDSPPTPVNPTIDFRAASFNGGPGILVPTRRIRIVNSSAGLENIRWIVFDAVGTVLFAEPSVPAAYCAIGRRFGSSITPEEAGRRFRDAARASIDLNGNDPLSTSEAGEKEFWRRTVEAVLPDVSQPAECFAELYDHFALPESWGCYPDVAGTLKALGARGFRLALASNFDARLHSVCAGHPELAQVETRVISSEIGWKKPSPRFFAAVIQACDVRPNEILMVGDDFANDVEPALAAGIHAVHLERTGRGGDTTIATLEQLLERLPATP